MPLNIVDESYNGNNSLIANAGDWIPFETNFSTRFSVGSGVSNTITYNHIGSNVWLTHQQGDFSDYGFLAGDVITITWSIALGNPFCNQQSATATISYISGTLMYLTAPLLYTAFCYVGQEVVNGRVFPTLPNYSGMLITANKVPASIEAQINLAPNGTSSLGSVIDGELNRFRVDDTSAMIVGQTEPLVQLVNKSGGYIKDAELTHTASDGLGNHDWKITGSWWSWGVIKDGYAEPNYYDNADCLAPIFKIIAFAEFANPNGTMTDVSTNTQANTGGFDENYNGGVNNYTPISIEWFDFLGNPIDALDYSNECTFEALVDAPNQSNPQSTYRIGLVFRPIDASVYEHKVTDIAQNLMLNSPEVDFIGDGSIDATVYAGFVNSDGAEWSLTDLQFTIIGAQLQINGKVIPNAQAFTYFANFPDGERKSTLWLSIGNFNLTGIYDDRVSLKLFDTDNYDAPNFGVQIPDVVNEFMFDHGGIDITDATDPNTTTEDDVLYTSQFRLIDNVDYEGVRARIYAFNTVTEEQFTLEDIFFSFANVVNINGQFQPNEVVSRGFNLPPSTDRNIISLIRVPSLDIAGKYGVEINYGYLSRWEYWLSQPNVNNDFFDFSEIYFDGKNKNWQRFFAGDWIIRLSYYTRVDGIDDFQDKAIGIRPYEDEDAFTTWSFLVLSTGATPADLVANEIIKATAQITWNVGTYSNVWCEMTIEDFESGNRWVISSVLAQGGISTNPLQPFGINAGLEVTFPSPNVAQLVAIIDTNVVNASKVCLSARIYSEENPIFPYEYPIPFGDQARLAYSTMYKLSPINVYNGAIMRVRRSIDDAELDIPFNNVEIDQIALLNFTGTGVDNNGYIVKLYDQSGDNNHASASIGNQALIVKDGIVQTSSNGFVAGLSDGVSTKYTISTPVPALQLFSYFHVFDRISSGIRSVGLATSGTAPIPIAWTAIDRIIDIMGITASIWEIDLTSGNFLLSCLRDNLDNMIVNKNGVATANSPINVPYVPAQFFDQLIERSVPIFTHDGFFQEIILFINDQSANFIGIENNIKNRYNIP